VGNHVIPYKNTLKINALDLLLNEYKSVTNLSEPTVLEFDDCKIMMVPWICDDNYEDTMKMMLKTDAQICFGHLELGGFEMHKGAVHHEGMDSRLFNKFDLVCSGHFHHRSSRGNIHYLGCPYEMTWSDYNDEKGFHVFDTEKRSLTFIPNPYKMYYKVSYDDSNTTLKDLIEQDFSQYNNTYVKVVVKNKNNPYWFDMFIDALEKSNAVNIQVVDDNLNLNLESDEDIIDEAEDTLTILKKYVENLELDADKLALDSLMRSLYEEAISIE
jgi:DNA repair exonuclease SbcCD nuclease subunit